MGQTAGSYVDNIWVTLEFAYYETIVALTILRIRTRVVQGWCTIEFEGLAIEEHTTTKWHIRQ